MSQPPDRPPCMCGTVRLDCPWFSPSQLVLWTYRLILLVVPSGLEPEDTHQRRMWPVAHPIRLVLREGNKEPF